MILSEHLQKKLEIGQFIVENEYLTKDEKIYVLEAVKSFNEDELKEFASIVMEQSFVSEVRRDRPDRIGERAQRSLNRKVGQPRMTDAAATKKAARKVDLMNKANKIKGGKIKQTLRGVKKSAQKTARTGISKLSSSKLGASKFGKAIGGSRVGQFIGKNPLKAAGIAAAAVGIGAIMAGIAMKRRANKKFWEDAKSRCTQAPDQKTCMKTAKKAFLTKELAAINSEKGKCSKNPDPQKCTKALDKKVKDIQGQMTKADKY